jgi:hypothetical protein
MVGLMHLHLFVSDLHATQDLLRLGHPLDMVWRFGHASLLNEPMDAHVLRLCGLVQEGNTPLANVLAMGESLANNAPNSALYLVQPVSLQLQRDTIALGDVVRFDHNEYVYFTQLLNQHFSQEGLQLMVSESQQCWFLGVAQHAKTHLAQATMHQNIYAYQPTGDGATLLKQMMNEAQMLLHDNAYNHQRERKNLPPFNSLWFSGNGVLPISPPVPLFGSLVGSSAMINGLQQYFQLPTHATWQNALASTDNKNNSNNNNLKDSQAKQILMHVEDIKAMEWDALMQHVKSRKLKTLTLYLTMSNQILKSTFSPIDAMKIWRKPKSFEQLIKVLMHEN